MNRIAKTMLLAIWAVSAGIVIKTASAQCDVPSAGGWLCGDDWNIQQPTWGQWFSPGDLVGVNWEWKNVSEDYKVRITWQAHGADGALTPQCSTWTVDNELDNTSFNVPCNAVSTWNGNQCASKVLMIEVFHEGRLCMKQVAIQIVYPDPNKAPEPELNQIYKCGSDQGINVCVKSDREKWGYYITDNTGTACLSAFNRGAEDRKIIWWELNASGIDPFAVDDQYIYSLLESKEQKVLTKIAEGEALTCINYQPSFPLTALVVRGEKAIRPNNNCGALQSPLTIIPVVSLPDVVEIIGGAISPDDAAITLYNDEALKCAEFRCKLAGSFFQFPSNKLLKNIIVSEQLGVKVKSVTCDWVYDQTGAEDYMTIYGSLPNGEKLKKVCYSDLVKHKNEKGLDYARYRGTLTVTYTIEGKEYPCTQNIYLTLTKSGEVNHKVEQFNEIFEQVKDNADVTTTEEELCRQVALIWELFGIGDGAGAQSTSSEVFVCPADPTEELRPVVDSSFAGSAEAILNSLFDFRWSPADGLNHPDSFATVVSYGAMSVADGQYMDYTLGWKLKGDTGVSYQPLYKVRVFKDILCGSLRPASNDEEIESESADKVTDNSVLSSNKDETKYSGQTTKQVVHEIKIPESDKAINHTATPKAEWIQGLKRQVYMNIYPNPANDRLFVEFKLQDEAQGMVKIHDMLGRTIVEKPAFASDKFIEFDLSTLEKGHYVVSLETSERPVVNKKLVIIK